MFIDMEMPTSCWECYFQDCGNCVLNNHKVVDNCILEDRRDDDCPLVPVPKHGRLIDADEFLKRAIGTKCFRGDYALMLEELIGESITIIPTEDNTEFYTKGHLHLGREEEGET